MSCPAATAAAGDPHPRSWARLALEGALVLAGAVAAIVVVALLSSHPADAATPVAKGSVAGAPGSIDPAPVKTLIPGTTPVRHPVPPVPEPVTTVTEPVRQTIWPVVQQVAPATAPVRQALRPVLQQVAPATIPIGQAVGGVVPPAAATPNSTVAAPGSAGPLVTRPEGPTPTTCCGSVSGVIEVPGATAPSSSGLAPTAIGPSVIGRGTSVPEGTAGVSGSSAGSGSQTVNLRGAATLGPSLEAASSAASPDGAGLPASSWPSGAGAVPTPMGSGGSGHGSGGLSSSLASRSLVFGLLAAIIGLIALWSAGRPAPRPEVSPA